MRLAALQSVVNAGSAGLSGYPRPRVVPISRAACGATSCVVPRALASRVHPLLSLASSSEYNRFETCPPHGCGERLPWSSRSPSRQQSWRSTCDRASNPDLRSVLGVSHALDGFRPPRPCGLVSSHNHVRDSPLRGFPRDPADPSFDGSYPLVVRSPTPTASCPATPAPLTPPPGSSSRLRSVVPTRRFRPRRNSIPSQASLLRVLLQASCRGLHRGSTHDLRSSIPACDSDDRSSAFRGYLA
jgi:hypothetical protein